MGVFLGIFQKVSATAYFIEQIRWLFFEICFSIRKEFLKKKVEILPLN